MKPGENTAETADELVEETETETSQGDSAEALEDALTEAVTESLNEDDEPGESDDDDLLDLEDDDLDGEDLDEDEDEEEGGEGEGGEGAGTAAAADPAKPAETAAAGDAAAATETGAAAEQPSWQPFAVTANKEQVPIEEAQVTRSGGNVFLAIPEKDFGRFQTRISRGVLFERVSRQLETERRELEARKSAPARKTDAEIEAEITLEAVKPFLGDLFDEKDLDLLKLRVKDAQRDARENYEKTERERVEKANAEPWEETQVRGLADSCIEVWQSFPELKGLSEDDMKAVYVEELLPVRNALFYKQGDDILANTQYIYDRLKARAAKSPAGGVKPATTESSSTTAASAPTPAPKGNPGSTASPKGKTTADKAERFNRAVDSAPRTTSVKANRGTRPGKAATRDAKGKIRRRSEREEQVVAEDTWRNTERAYLSSNSLDFE